MALKRSARSFVFHTALTVEASVERAHEVLLDLEHYVDWWPQVRAVAKIDDDTAVVVCRSVLPYDLELTLTAQQREGDVLRVGIDGPIRGHAQWRLGSVADGTRLEFDQRVDAVGPLFVAASYVVRPLLTRNHQLMMRGCVTGLRARLSDDPEARTPAQPS